ncbi:hypothetical protein ACQKIE_06915 [Luteibacter sp. NPDC031894]|uniref:hypothetical protein n=1 Tax=Luteibacter sp. NPDC031894 TaxID=3390572 RepID=UPI003D086EE8
MSNVIDFLERMGADAALRAAGADELTRELTASGVEGDLAAAILAGDEDTLRARLAPRTFYGIQLDREKEDPDPEQERKDDEEATVRLAQYQA